MTLYAKHSRDELIEEIEEYRALCDQLSGILTRTANALKGEPKPRHRHSWHDLPEVAARSSRNWYFERLNPTGTIVAKEPSGMTHTVKGGRLDSVDGYALLQVMADALTGKCTRITIAQERI